MTSLDFFRNSNVIDRVFFDEGPKIQFIKQVYVEGEFHNTSSISTIDIDGYRQGVELTLQKHFDAGTVKIHAGEPGHMLRKTNFGMGETTYSKIPFEEVDYFDPRNFISLQENDPAFYRNINASPIITNDNNSIENYIFDGAIEPFSIRSRVAFFSVDAPYEMHEIKGTVMNGNSDDFGGSDTIQNVFVNDVSGRYESGPFKDHNIDMVSFARNRQTISFIGASVGFFNSEKSKIIKFVDKRYVRNTVSDQTYDPDMTAALSLMSGSSDNYVNTTINEMAATAGWLYDNSVAGTDSLAFGGMTY